MFYYETHTQYDNIHSVDCHPNLGLSFRRRERQLHCSQTPISFSLPQSHPQLHSPLPPLLSLSLTRQVHRPQLQEPQPQSQTQTNASLSCHTPTSQPHNTRLFPHTLITNNGRIHFQTTTYPAHIRSHYLANTSMMIHGHYHIPSHSPGFFMISEERLEALLGGRIAHSFAPSTSLFLNINTTANQLTTLAMSIHSRYIHITHPTHPLIHHTSNYFINHVRVQIYSLHLFAHGLFFSDLAAYVTFFSSLFIYPFPCCGLVCSTSLVSFSFSFLLGNTYGLSRRGITIRKSHWKLWQTQEQGHGFLQIEFWRCNKRYNGV